MIIGEKSSSRARRHVNCVWNPRSVWGPGRVTHSFRVFKTFTADFEVLIAWLVEQGISTVPMEATCVYWISR
jgi:hypothetical protein